MDDWLARFLAQERLPEGFMRTFEEVCWPLADRCEEWRTDFGRSAVVGLCGPQGSGKTTIATAAVSLLRRRGLNAVALSLDDFYLGREARGWLAGKVHRLLQVRGPPGTHDVALACSILDHLKQPGETPLPAFDKATDERVSKGLWRNADGPVDVVILEGWCVGARPEPSDRLRRALNPMEQRDDPTGAWRGYVNRQLGESYQALFARLDRLVFLEAPGWEVVRGWRAEQEAKLRASRPGAGMTDAEIGRFVQHYERLTRWMLEEMPGRADWLIKLMPDRTPVPMTHGS